MGGTVSDDSMSGLAAAVLTIPQTITTNNLTGTITYEYHHHDNTCYCDSTSFTNMGTFETVIRPGVEGVGIHWKCNKCGNNFDMALNASPKCTKQICGYAEGQVVSATITY